MDKEKALQLWDRLFPGKEEAYDYASHKMRRDDFQNEESEFSWDVDMIRSRAFGGSYMMDNLLPAALSTIGLRGGKNSFRIGALSYEVRKGRRYGTFAIYDTTDREAPLDMTPDEGTQDPAFNEARMRRSLGVKEGKTERNFFRPDFSKPLQNGLFRADIEKEGQDVPPAQAPEESVPQKEEEEMLPVFGKPIEAQEGEDVKVEETPESPKENPIVEGDIPVVDEEATVVLDAEEKAHDIPVQETSSLSNGIVEGDIPVEGLDTPVVEEQQEEDEALEASQKVELDRKDEMIASLTREKEGLEHQIETLKSEKNQVVLEKDELLKKATEKDDLLSRLSAELEAKKNAESRQAEELMQKQQESETKIHDAQEEKESLLNEKEALQNRLSALQSEKEGLQSQNTALIEERDGLQSQNAALVEEKNGLQNQIATVQTEKDGLQEQYHALQEEKASLEKEKSALLEEKTKIQNDCSLLQEKLSAAEKANGELQQGLSEKAGVSEALKHLQAQLSQTQEESAKEKAEYESRLSLAETEKKALEEKIAGLSSALEEGKKALSEKEEAYRSLEAQKESLSQSQGESLAQKEQDIKKLQEEKEALLVQRASDQLELERLQVLEKERKEQSEKDVLLRQEFENRIHGLEEEKQSLEAEKAASEKEKEELRGEISAINEKGMQNEALMVEKDKRIQELVAEKESDKAADTALVEEGKKHIEELERSLAEKEESLRAKDEQILLAKAFGKVEDYGLVKEKLLAAGKAFTMENVEELLEENPDFVQPINSRIYKAPAATKTVEEEIAEDKNVELAFQADEREKKAYRYYEELIGEGKLDATDFASREIKERHYRREDTPFGWDYALFDPEAPEEGNVFVANLKTIAEYKPGSRFFANGHEFQVEEKNGRKHFVALDTIADPFDFENAIAVSESNLQKKAPLIYIYMKACGVNSTIPERKDVSAFFDIVDRTVRRCAPASFIEMQAHSGSNSDYVFLTFDGSKANAYKEAFDYAILLNSYRAQFKKRGGVDAIVVLDEIEVPFSMRHFTFDRLYSETKDIDLNALRYDLNLTTVINSTIKRTVHIGPEILDKVPIAKEKLKPSRLGMGTFSDLFGFGKSYMECNFVFDLTRKADEESND